MVHMIFYNEKFEAAKFAYFLKLDTSKYTLPDR